ncbi:MAG: hypothetical protein O4753_15880 [Trichodesmium sp. St7_bin2_1]|nr:hypothetical protein [Trichodesmium sp. St7_bin2_1]
MWVLLVYILAKGELKNTLKIISNILKNQLGKLTNTPTLRWIFQWFQGIHLLTINQSRKVVNPTEERSLILELLPYCCKNIFCGCDRTPWHAIALPVTGKLIDALNACG